MLPSTEHSLDIGLRELSNTINLILTVTMVSAVIMSLLFLSELNYYLSVQVDQELIVDTMRGQKMKIFVDVTFPRIGCKCK